MTREEKIICKHFLDDADKTHSCNEYKLLMALLEQEPRKGEVILTKEEYGELVSSEFDNGYAKGYREALEQEPKIGHWICDGKGRNFADYHCSECGHKLALCGQDIKQRQDSGYSLFCDGCGARMESEDQE